MAIDSFQIVSSIIKNILLSDIYLSKNSEIYIFIYNFLSRNIHTKIAAELSHNNNNNKASSLSLCYTNNLCAVDDLFYSTKIYR